MFSGENNRGFDSGSRTAYCSLRWIDWGDLNTADSGKILKGRCQCCESRVMRYVNCRMLPKCDRDRAARLRTCESLLFVVLVRSHGVVARRTPPLVTFVAHDHRATAVTLCGGVENGAVASTSVNHGVVPRRHRVVIAVRSRIGLPVQLRAKC